MMIALSYPASAMIKFSNVETLRKLLVFVAISLSSFIVSSVNAGQVMRVAVEHCVPLCDIIIAVDTTSVDQETEAGNVEWVPCVSIYVPEEKEN
jgi:hypothetical protein